MLYCFFILLLAQVTKESYEGNSLGGGLQSRFFLQKPHLIIYTKQTGFFLP